MGVRVENKVVDALGPTSGGRLLDVPAGDSPVVAAAREAGWSVVGLDLFPKAGSLAVRADACRPFPFKDESFDALVTLEGIEHFENQAAFLRECARVLRPGGRFVLTTPNVLHLSARMSAFLTFQRTLKRGFVNEDQTLRSRDGDRLYHGHAFLIDVFRLRYLMAITGLRIDDVHWTKRSPSSLLLAPLLPLIWGMTRASLASGRRTRAREGLTTARPEVEAEIRRLADSPTLMLCKHLVVTGYKEPARGEVPTSRPTSESAAARSSLAGRP